MRLWFSRRVLKNPSVRGAHCTFEITLSGTITLTLLLVCAFSPKVQKYLLGSPLTDFRVPPKKQNIANYRRFLCFDNDGQYHRQLLVILVYELANGFADYRL